MFQAFAVRYATGLQMLVGVPSHHGSGFAVQLGLGDVRSIYTRLRLLVIQSRIVHVLANCFQEVEANVQSYKENNNILTFGIRPYQFLTSAV